MKSKLIKGLLLLMAFIALGLGLIGIFVPVLPTTPLLLLASFLFSKGSDKFHMWFISTGIYKKHLEDFLINRSMTLRRKLCILLPVSGLLIVTFFYLDRPILRFIILAVILFKYYYFTFHIKTLEQNYLNDKEGEMDELG